MVLFRMISLVLLGNVVVDFGLVVISWELYLLVVSIVGFVNKVLFGFMMLLLVLIVLMVVCIFLFSCGLVIWVLIVSLNWL